MSLARKMRTFAMMDSRRRHLVMEASATMLLGRIALATLPFAMIGRWMGPFTAPGLVSQGLMAAEDGQVAEVRRAIATAAPNLPFRSDCMVQALAGHAMCRRRGLPSTVHMGVIGGAPSIAGETHAWVDAGGVEICGYPLPAGTVEVSCFPGNGQSEAGQ